jgi:hypothetical protein
MWRTGLQAILTALTVAALGIWAARTAQADGPAGGAAPVLEAQPSASVVSGEQSVTLTARLRSSAGEAVSGTPVTFYVLSTVFGERLMKVGDVLTDTTGTASLVYKPTWVGDQTVVVRYGGSSEFAPQQVSFQFSASGPLPEHENARFGLEPIRRWAPIAIGAVVLAVWGTLGLVLLRTVRGIPAAAAPVGVAPMPAPMPQGLRPVPVGPALALVAAVLLLALPGAYFLQRERGGDVSLSTGDVRFSDGGGQDAAGSTPGVTLPEKPLAATLVRSIPATVTDAAGQLTPGSADLPADVAKIMDRLYVLDTNRGRILVVGSDGKLAPIFESTGTGDVSLHGATAMTVHSGQLYVANSLAGDVVVIDPSGHLEGVIKPQVPAGQNPLRPSGIAVTSRGEIWLSDADNHRVLFVNGQGEFLGVIGEGSQSSGEHGFNTPGGLALEQEGNLYVADTLNHQVKKYSPMGVFLTAFGADRLAEPKAVAVDNTGNVFVSDDKLMAVLAFGPDGSYLGSIGREGAANAGSPSLFQAPDGLKVEGGMLYVMDRLAGLFVFRLESGSGQ